MVPVARDIIRQQTRVTLILLRYKLEDGLALFCAPRGLEFFLPARVQLIPLGEMNGGDLIFLKPVETVRGAGRQCGHEEPEYASGEEDEQISERPIAALDLINPTARATPYAVETDNRAGRYINDKQLASRIPVRVKAVDRAPPDFRLARFCSGPQLLFMLPQIRGHARKPRERDELSLASNTLTM